MITKQQLYSAAGSGLAQEVDIPLPLRGLFVEARSARVSNLFASDLHNFTSTGLKLTTRPGVTWQGTPEQVLQRIPHRFGAQNRYILITPDKAECGAVEIARTWGSRVNFTTLSSNTLMSDGFGPQIRFDGTEFHECDFTVSTSARVRKFDGILAHHDRPYLWQTGGPLEFYYGDVGAVTGHLDRFPLDRLGNINGTIINAASLTIDAGHGMNDVLAIFTSTGQVVAFEGLDPGDPNDWRLLGRVQAAAPISPGAFAQVGSDLWMLTERGVISIAESVRSSTLALVSELSRPASEMILSMVEEGPADWQMVAAEDASAIIINQVIGRKAKQVQYTPKSGAWSTADVAARDLHSIGRAIEYTGFDGRLGTQSRSGSDEVMTARWLSSWFDVGRTAHCAWIKPVIRALNPLVLRVYVIVDHLDTATDIAEAMIEVAVNPEEDDGGIITLSDEIAIGATGRSFQIMVETEATWAEIIGMSAGIA